MKLKKYLLFLSILAATFITARPINGQVYYEDVSEKYEKLAELYSEIEYAFSDAQYSDVINLSGKLKDIGFSYNDLEEDEEDDNSEERAIWIDIIWFRGLAQSKLGNYKEAEEDFKFILENAKNPSSFVYTYYAEALSKQGDYKGAISILENGVKYLEDKISDRDMHELLWNLGWFYYLDKQYKKSIIVGFKCSEINPYSTGPLFNTSLALLALKDENNAIRYFLKAFNSSFLYGDEFKDWILKSVIDDVNNYIEEYGESDNLNTMLFLAYKGLDETMASNLYGVYLMDEPLGNYSDLVDEPTSPFLYVIASTYSLKKNSLVDKYLIELRAQDQSYIEKSKNDPDFDWYYSTHKDKKINKPKHINNKPKHIKKKRR